MNASSQYDDYNHEPFYGRHNSDRGDGWCAYETNRNDDWLHVDLGKTEQLCAVAPREKITILEKIHPKKRKSHEN